MCVAALRDAFRHMDWMLRFLVTLRPLVRNRPRRKVRKAPVIPRKKLVSALQAVRDWKSLAADYLTVGYFSLLRIEQISLLGTSAVLLGDGFIEFTEKNSARQMVRVYLPKVAWQCMLRIKSSEAITKASLAQAVRIVADEAALPVSSHSLRRSAAVHLVLGGCALELVMLLGRWGSLRSLRAYLNDLDLSDLWKRVWKGC